MLKKSLRKLSEYPRLRVLLIVAVIVVVIVIVFELFTPKSKNTQLPPVPGSVIQNQNLGQPHTTTIGTSQREAEAANIKNQNLANKVKSGADVFMSGLFGGESGTSSSTTTTPSNSGVVKSPEQIQAEGQGSQTPPVLSPSQLEKALNNPQQQGPSMPQQGYPSQNNNNQNQMGAAQAQSQMESQMRSSMDSYSSQWNLPVQTKVGSEADASGGGGGGGASNLPKLPAVNMIKAGTILFAVLENALNSDQNGTPVLAQIATGKYRGAELIGTFTTSSDDKLIIQFTRMVLKDLPDAISITAYAIDPATAQNALASGVSHHYLERYGSLFAASLLQGFGNAYSNYQNPCYGTNNCFIDGSVQRTDVTTKTAMYQGLGQIGTNVASQVQNNFNRPDTVYLKQGSGMGILFMDNVTNQSAGAVAPSTMIGNPAALKTFGNTTDAGTSLSSGQLSSGQLSSGQ